MKKLLLTIMIVATSMTVLVAEAEARRFGGGFRSFGRQSTFRSHRAPTQKVAPRTGTKSTAGTTSARRPSRWGGMLGGALLGLGLGSLLGHMGIGGGMASMISTLLLFGLIGFGIMFLFRMMARKQGRNPFQPAANTDPHQRGHSNYDIPEIGSGINQQAPSLAYSNDGPVGVPTDFDVPAFLRGAKTYFIRLQAAWDAADIDDIREFTTPEMFGELRLQLQERGTATNHTDVVSLEAELLGIESISENEQMASVLFSGSIKEDLNAAAEPFSETWNLTRSLSSKGGWVVAGIQQTS